MITFNYKAQTDEGSKISGTIVANSSNAAAIQLEELGYIPLSISEKKDGFLQNLDLALLKVKAEDLIFFTRQLRTIIKSGIPLLTGLEAISEQTENKKLKKTISDVCCEVDQGNSLSSALSKHPQVFSDVYHNMVHTGEMGGNLKSILEQLILVLEFNRKTTDNLKSAMRYPLMVIIALCTAFFFLVTFVIPKFSKIFASSKMNLPLPTRIMIGTNYVVQNYWFLIIGGIGLGATFFCIYIRTESGRIAWDRARLKIPILGPVFLKIYMSRFSYMLEALSRSGVPIVHALETVSGAIGNEYIAIKIKEMSKKLNAGRKISDSVRESGIFPPLVYRMISTGEDTGTLDEMLHEVAEFYSGETEYTVSRLSSYIEPVLTIVLGIMVLFMALAIFLPWWDMIKVFKGGG
ncbi:MAG: type II secretion system F family protein [bacterium]